LTGRHKSPLPSITPSPQIAIFSALGNEKNIQKDEKDALKKAEQHYDFYRPVMVSLEYCDRVLLEGVTFMNSPAWNLHPRAFKGTRLCIFTGFDADCIITRFKRTIIDFNTISAMGRGGVVEDIEVSHIQMTGIKHEAVILTMSYVLNRPMALLKRTPTSVPKNVQFSTKTCFTPRDISLPTTKPPCPSLTRQS